MNASLSKSVHSSDIEIVKLTRSVAMTSGGELDTNVLMIPFSKYVAEIATDGGTLEYVHSVVAVSVLAKPYSSVNKFAPKLTPNYNSELLAGGVTIDA